MAARDNAALTADTVLLAAAGGIDHVLLIRRGGEPFAGRWAFPGGFVERDEDLRDGALRELREETGLDPAAPLRQLGAYGSPDRDPRGRVVSVAWWARLAGADSAGSLPSVAGGDDAADARWLPVEQVLRGDELAFDHAHVLRDALAADAAARPAAGIAVRFDLPDADALAEFDRLVADVLPGIRDEEPGTLTYAVHEVDGAPLARLFFETYTPGGHADHEGRAGTAAFLERVRGLVSGVRVEHLVQRDAVRR